MDIFKKLSRRQILSSAGILGLGSALGKSLYAGTPQAKPISLKKNAVILFQGDSITDARRQNRNAPKANDQASMGGGYASMAASALLNSKPEFNLSILNRGISGNKVHQLEARWERDCLSHRPDILSILIGVNDIWHGIQGKYDGTVQRYEDDFLALLNRTRKALPQVQLVICEPFVLRCGAVNERWFPEFDRYRESARKVADQNQATFVPFQEMFDRALSYAPPEHWAKDGVHPSQYGAALMADTWLRAVRG